MESEIGRNRQIAMGAGHSRARLMVLECVDGEERRAGSRMLAYENVGRRIGRGPTWIRRLIGGVAVGLAQDTYEKLVDAYDRHCAKLEAEAETTRKRAEAIRAQNDALEERLMAAGREGP